MNLRWTQLLCVRDIFSFVSYCCQASFHVVFIHHWEIHLSSLSEPGVLLNGDGLLSPANHPLDEWPLIISDSEGTPVVRSKELRNFLLPYQTLFSNTCVVLHWPISCSVFLVVLIVNLFNWLVFVVITSLKSPKLHLDTREYANAWQLQVPPVNYDKLSKYEKTWNKIYYSFNPAYCCDVSETYPQVMARVFRKPLQVFISLARSKTFSLALFLSSAVVKMKH